MLIVFVESGVDPAQYRLEWNSSIFPGFHQSPIERRNHQQCSPAALKVLFNLGEVVEIIELIVFSLIDLVRSSTAGQRVERGLEGARSLPPFDFAGTCGTRTL